MMDTFQCTILLWYQKHGRKLPWRETTDPYNILVSEMMLQQTQVSRVIPYYHAFLKQFPTVQSLATTPVADVIRQWSGLGYNRRALYLHSCAKAICKAHNGLVPRTVNDLVALPGIGPYTAAAILSFAYNKDIPVVDVNIALLYRRIFYGTKNIDHLAKSHLPKGRSREWHNALMDIGALYCTARNPHCLPCPVRQFCASACNTKRHDETRKRKVVVPFPESDRIVRGAIVTLLTKAKSQTVDEIFTLLREKNCGRKREHVITILTKLEHDGLVVKKGRAVTLP